MDDDVVEVMARTHCEAVGRVVPCQFPNCLFAGTACSGGADAMQAAITALEKKGYAVVPVEPTEAMVSAAFAHVYPVDRRRALQAVIDVIAARPKCAA